MTVSLATIQKLATLGLSTEQMAGVLEVLTVELAPLEALEQEKRERLAKDRARKFRGNIPESSMEIPRTIHGNSVETPRKASRVEDNIYKPTLVDISKPPVVPHQDQDPDGFDAFWAAYPKRDGNADRKGAVKAFGPAVKRAGDHALIARAAARYAAHCREKGKSGTEFVKQARSWLNGDLWREWLPQEPQRPAVSRVPVREGSPAWQAWKATGRRFNAMDLKDEQGRVVGRGWYFETEFPPKETAA